MVNALNYHGAPAVSPSITAATLIKAHSTIVLVGLPLLRFRHRHRVSPVGVLLHVAKVHPRIGSLSKLRASWRQVHRMFP